MRTISTGRKWEPRPDSEFTIFNLVIRLSKVEQLDIFRVLPCRLSLCWTTGRRAWPHPSFSKPKLCCQPWYRETSFFFNDALETAQLALTFTTCEGEASGHAFLGVVLTLFRSLVRFTCALTSTGDYFSCLLGWSDQLPRALSLISTLACDCGCIIVH